MAYEQIENDALRLHQDWSVFNSSQRKLLGLSQRLARSPISFTSETRVLTNGEETFGTLLMELRQAQHHIHMEYYIFRADEIGTRIQQILIEKPAPASRSASCMMPWAACICPRVSLRL